MIRVKAFAVVRKTHNADIDHQTRYFEKDFFASRNRRSSPTFKTLMKRKTPNRIAQKDTIPIIIFVLSSRFMPDDDVVKKEAVKEESGKQSFQ